MKPFAVAGAAVWILAICGLLWLAHSEHQKDSTCAAQGGERVKTSSGWICAKVQRMSLTRKWT